MASASMAARSGKLTRNGCPHSMHSAWMGVSGSLLAIRGLPESGASLTEVRAGIWYVVDWRAPLTPPRDRATGEASAMHRGRHFLDCAGASEAQSGVIFRVTRSLPRRI